MRWANRDTLSNIGMSPSQGQTGLPYDLMSFDGLMLSQEDLYPWIG